MAIIAKDPGGGDFTPAPAGQHAVVCCDVFDMGLMESSFKPGKKVHKIRISWMLSECMEDGRPFLASKMYTLSLHEKASLRKDLESWRGLAFTAKELEGFDVESVLAAPALISLIHVVKSEKTYANLSSIMALPKEMRIHPVFHVSLLRRFEGEKPEGPNLPVGFLPIADPNDWEVEDVLGKKTDDESGQQHTFYLVHWKGEPAAEATWEPVENLGGIKRVLRRFDRKRTTKAFKRPGDGVQGAAKSN